MERGREEGGERELSARVGRGDGGVFEGDGGAHGCGAFGGGKDGKKVMSWDMGETLRVWNQRRASV